jgi:Tfp pilus assembly protein PilF
MTAAFLRSLCILAPLLAVSMPAAAQVNAASQQASRVLADKGGTALADGEGPRAKRLLEAAIVAAPANARALAQLGRYYQSQNQRDLARKYYQFALAVEPTEPDALLGAGKIDLADGKADGAKDKLRILRLSCPTCTQTADLAAALNSTSPANNP